MQTIEGTVAEIIYEGADGYTVLGVEAEEPTVVVGNMPDLKTGERVRFFGVFKAHKKYGEQFFCESYESTLPVEADDIALFLGGGFIRGVGEVLALRIVEAFKNDTFDIIENDYTRLKAVKGVSARLAEEIHAAFLEYSTKKIVYARLMGLGLSAKQAAAAAKALGDSAAERVRENPYLLISAVKGIGFKEADRIAQGIGIEKASPMRVKYGVMHVLRQSMYRRGYTCVPEARLIDAVKTNLFVDEDAVNSAVLELTLKKTIARRRIGGVKFVFLRSLYNAESSAAVKLLRLLLSGERMPIDFLDVKLKAEQEKYGFSDEQITALSMALKNNVCIITGGPGTGKTTILKSIINVLAGSGLTFLLGAPTGRAAKRMEEACGVKASTLHRMLEYAHEEDSEEGECIFRRNAENPLEADAVIVDEASMIDVFLLSSLCAAITEGTRLILVGDADQLPSVGPGNVMEDIIKSGALPVAQLTKIYRNEGGIAYAAREILGGETPESGEDFVFLECADEGEALSSAVSIYEDVYKNGGDVQAVAPVKDGVLGTRTINAAIREKVNPRRQNRAETTFGSLVLREGDRVMQIKNNYSREWTDGEAAGEGVFNGEIGEVARIDAGSVYISFDGRLCVYETADLAEIDGAYCYTIHKSQGSEFDTVIMTLMYEPMPFFSRNLLYTGVTRAKQKVIILGDRQTLDYMVKNAKRNFRYSYLGKKLTGLKGLAGSAI